ncbi:MAG: 2-isopropylmalate synthase [Mycoplasmatales bacterium]
MNVKYLRSNYFVLPERTWINNRITKAPLWCSVDLRDGNQALVNPMSIENKVKFFLHLVKIGFKEIEVAFPSSSQTEFNFVRHLIEHDLIPNDVTIQVTVQARSHLIERTFEAVKGAKNVIIHLYNSTSILQREIVFRKSKEEVLHLALAGVEQIMKLLKNYPETTFKLQYSPESFEGTEIEYALEIVNAIIDKWQPRNKNLIINLPLTMEIMTPIEYADRVEFMVKHMLWREQVVVCVHTHNDRGCAVAATETALLAGVDRVEGTLFGNGERTGNADLVTLALNLFTQGIDCELDFCNLPETIEIYKQCVKMEIHQRHPYAGNLVFTAFSGSHQDAIRKGLEMMNHSSSQQWRVPYLAIDPYDIGRNYEKIIRINSQSGKGGVVYVLEKEFNLKLPKDMHVELGEHAKRISVEQGGEIDANALFSMFKHIYTLDVTKLVNYQIKNFVENVEIECEIVFLKKKLVIKGIGNGTLDAFMNGLSSEGFMDYTINQYTEHSLNQGSKADAITYIQVKKADGQTHFGVGIGSDTTRCALEAIFAAIANIELETLMKGLEWKK